MFYKLYSILICLMFFSLIGCDKTEGDDGNLKGININVYVDLLVENEDGIDLLDPNVENSLNTNSIKLFYVNGNEKIEVYNPSLDFERNFKILEENSYYFLRLFVNDSIVNGYTETLLDWGNGELDSIKSIVSKTNTSIVCDSVWYNNKLEYPTNNEYSPRRMFRVVK